MPKIISTLPSSRWPHIRKISLKTCKKTRSEKPLSIKIKCVKYASQVLQARIRPLKPFSRQNLRFQHLPNIVLINERLFLGSRADITSRTHSTFSLKKEGKSYRTTTTITLTISDCWTSSKTLQVPLTVFSLFSQNRSRVLTITPHIPKSTSMMRVSQRQMYISLQSRIQNLQNQSSTRQ